MNRSPFILRAAAFHALLAALAAWFAWNHAGLVDRHAGFLPPPARPGAMTDMQPNAPARAQHGRVVVVLLDGVGQHHAQGLAAVARIAERGACWPSRALLPSMSRPNYVAISTGVPPSHGGVRGNLDETPVHVENAWALARAAGRRVRLVAEADWWSPVLAGAVDEHVVEDMPGALPGPDITLWHVLSTDHAAHDEGTTSEAFASALRDADARLLAVLDTLDTTRDTLMLTADHGHRARGGHGGAQPEVLHTLTCAAGPAIQHAELPRKAATFHALVLARVMGTRFPADAHVGPDDAAHLSALTGPLTAAESTALDVARERWAHVDLHATAPSTPLAIAWCLLLLVGAWVTRRKELPATSLLLPLFAWAVWSGWTDATDLSAVNTRTAFSTIVVVAALLPVGAWLVVRGRSSRFPRASVPGTASVFTALLIAVHAVVVGLPPSPPLPHPAVFFLPLPLSMCVATWSAATVVLLVVDAWRLRRGAGPAL